MQILYFFSSDNELDLEIIPAYLLALMQVEEIVIAWSYCSGVGLTPIYSFSYFGVLCCVYVPFWDLCAGAGDLSQ